MITEKQVTKAYELATYDEKKELDDLLERVKEYPPDEIALGLMQRRIYGILERNKKKHYEPKNQPPECAKVAEEKRKRELLILMQKNADAEAGKWKEKKRSRIE